MKRVGCCRSNNNCRAVLIIVKHGYSHALATNFFHDKAVRCLDIFQIDGAKCGLQRANNFGKFFRIAFIHFNVKAINICEFFEQNRLAFHHWL